MYTLHHPQILRIPFTITPKLPSSHSSTSQSHLPKLTTFPSPLRSSTRDGRGNDDYIKPPPPQITPPDTVEVRFRRGSKKRRQLQNSDNELQKIAMTAEKTAPKSWEEMTLSEKAIELYVGEKGLLFWLNKLAYASIFIIIGGWILFRFVGPAFNLYQLDSPPLSPDAILKGSS